MTLKRFDPANFDGRWERGEDAEPAGPTCGLCEDANVIGWRYTDATRQHISYIHCPDCIERRATAKRRTESGIDTTAMYNKTFSTFNPQLPGLGEAFRRCQEFAANPTGWLLLHGPYGTGKSHLAAAIGNAALARGTAVIFATVPDLLDQLRETFDGQVEKFEERFARFRSASLLILDDLGTQHCTPWAREKLFQLINHRYNAALPTVFTLNPEAFTTLDRRLESRLSDVSLVEHLSFDGAQDHRKLSFGQRHGKAA